jgi:hypothetical protein
MSMPSTGAIVRAATLSQQEQQQRNRWRAALAACGENPIAAEMLIKRRAAEGRLGWCSLRGRELSPKALFSAGLPEQRATSAFTGSTRANWAWRPAVP